MIYNILFFCFGLLGCQEQLAIDYFYLLRHPEVLNQQVLDCELHADKNPPSCKVVQHAAEDFSLFYNERRRNPESFGQQVMVAEAELVKKMIMEQMSLKVE